MKAKRILAIVLVGLSVVLAGCGTAQGTSASTSSSAVTTGSSTSQTTSTDGGVVKLAYIGPTTGDYSQYGTFAQRGMELKLDELGYKAGNYTIQLDYYDDMNDPKQSVTMAQNLLDDDELLAILGPFASTNALAVAPLIDKAGIIHFAVTSSHPDITAVGDYVFRGCHINLHEAIHAADFLMDDLGLQNFSIVYIKNDFGVTLYEAFDERVNEKGGTILEAADFIEGSTADFSPIITRLIENKPEAVYVVCFYNDTAACLKALDTLDYDGTVVINPGAATDELIALLGDQLEGVYSVMPFYLQDPTPSFVDFRERCNAAYDAEPNMFVLMHYDAMSALCAAIEEVGPDRKAVRDYLNSGVDLPGAGGPFYFTETRDPLKPFYPLVFEDGQFVLSN